MSSTDDEPGKEFFPEGSGDLGSIEQCNVLLLAVNEVLDKFVDLTYCQEQQGIGDQNDDEYRGKDGGEDHVREYACEVLSLGLLLMEFIDGIRESDGNHIICCWQYFLLHFKVSNRKNYAVEAPTLLFQYYFLFSPRMAMQLVWNRTVNVHGRTGRNVSCDLHMEYLN